MTEGPGAKGAPLGSPDEELDPQLRDPRVMAWFGEHLPELRRSVAEQRFLRSTLVIGFVAGLAVHAAGYLLKSSATTEPLGLAADLLYTLGLGLWTGVVVAVCLQIIPEAKRRQVERAIRAYEAARGKARAESAQASQDDEAPTAT